MPSYGYIYIYLGKYIYNINGQVRLVHLVRLQTDNFRLVLRQQKTNDKLPFVQ